VENLEKGFLINVFSGKNCPGLLVSILEAFEELGLDVLDARVSCEDNFQLEAIGGDQVRIKLLSFLSWIDILPLSTPLKLREHIFFESILNVADVIYVL